MAKKKLKFEDAINRLEDIVRDLENSHQTLEDSLHLFAEGVELSKFCQSTLEEAEKKIKLLTNDGRLTDFQDNDEE